MVVYRGDVKNVIVSLCVLLQYIYFSKMLYILPGHQVLFYITLQQEDLIDPGPILKAFIGLTDREQEMTFVWVDGTALTYANWHPDDPNDSDGTFDVVVMRGPLESLYGTWVDETNDAGACICEKPSRVTLGEIKIR